MDFAVTEHTFEGSEDRRWCATMKGYDTCRPVTLDVSAFLAAHISAKGAIPSGTILAKITASGKYGPYEPLAADGRQTATGILFNTTTVGLAGSDTALASAPDVAAAMLWEGVIDETYLPAFTGTVLGELDADGRTDLKHCLFE